MNAAAYSASGTRFIRVRYYFVGLLRRAEISLLRPGRRPRTRRLHDDPAPGAVALGVLRRVADRVLARELVGNLPVDAVQLGDLVREERPAAGLLGELPHHELRFLAELRAGIHR